MSNCKLCNRESTISIRNGLISCANPDCYMEDAEMPQEDWDSLMAPIKSLADIKADAIEELIKEKAYSAQVNGIATSIIDADGAIQYADKLRAKS